MCSEAEVGNVAGIALLVDINLSFNHEVLTISLCCASSSLQGFGMIAEGVGLIYPPGILIRIMTCGIWGQLNGHRESLLKCPINISLSWLSTVLILTGVIKGIMDFSGMSIQNSCLFEITVDFSSREEFALLEQDSLFL